MGYPSEGPGARLALLSVGSPPAPLMSLANERQGCPRVTPGLWNPKPYGSGAKSHSQFHPPHPYPQKAIHTEGDRNSRGG